MRKIFTLLALVLTSLASMAAETLVGETDYNPNGDTFDWTFDIDFKTQKLVSTLDLSGCTGTNENILSVGSDYFWNWYSVGNMTANMHFYYTKSTKTLTAYVLNTVSGEDGFWKYQRTVTGVEGTLTMEMSYQNGVTVNGKQVFGPEYLTLLYDKSSLHFGSREGESRSHATVKGTYVVDTEFAPETQTYSAYAKTLCDGKYTRMTGAEAVADRTGFLTRDLTFKQVKVDGKVLGDLTFRNVADTLMTGIASSTCYVKYLYGGTKAALTNVGEAATALGLAEGDSIETTLSAASYSGDFEAEIEGTVGEKTFTYSYNVGAPTVSTYTDKLSVSVADNTASYTDKTLTIADYGDGFCTVTVKDLQSGLTDETVLGDLVINELPVSFGSDLDSTFTAKDITVELANAPEELPSTITGASVDGKVFNSKAFFTAEGSFMEMPLKVVFGEALAKPEVYSEDLTVINNSDTTSYTGQEIAIYAKGDDMYTIVLRNLGDITGQDAVSFDLDGWIDEDTGALTFDGAAQAPVLWSGWDGYNINIAFAGKFKDGKGYAVADLDFGGYAAYGYDEFGYNLTYGTDFTVPTAINGVEDATAKTAAEYYTLDGKRVSGLQKGITIVRQGGKAVKVVK